ncbi:MAG: hypothetical protein ACFCUM_14920 [Bacteroidales bacterium]
MKRFFKVISVILATFIFLLAVTVSIIMWFVFTPDRLTPIVSNQSQKHIPYQTEIGKVELTLFSTFPEFGIKVNEFAVINPGTGAACDTIFRTVELTGVVDAREYWRNRNIKIHKFILSDVLLNAFTDSLGQSNFSMLMAASPDQDTETDEDIFIDLENIELRNMNISYTDLSAGMRTVISTFNAGISGTIRDDIINVLIDVSSANVSHEQDGEKLLEDTRIRFRIPAEIEVARQLISLSGAYASVNDMEIRLAGSVENDTLNNRIIADINYHLDSWQLNDVIALIPRSFLEEYGEFGARGLISSSGKIKGNVNDSLLPLLDISLLISEGTLEYHALPFGLKEMNGDIHFYSDMISDSVSYIDIRKFELKTPGSEFNTRGKVNHLFSDIHFDLVSTVNILTEEFRSFIPADLNLNVEGRVRGGVKSSFAMSQVENLLLDKMSLSGSASFEDFSMVYDSISVSTDHTLVDFDLPNPVISDRNTQFASVKVSSKILSATKTEVFTTSMNDANFYVEMSDVRDTTSIPDLFCTFSFDTFSAAMDTVGISVTKPLGNFSVTPLIDFPDRPSVKLDYTSFKIEAYSGNNSALIDDLTLNADIINNKEQEDIFLQWLATGFVDMKNGTITMSALNQPVEIPVIKMNFDPETFNIIDSRIIIEKSDFGLKGVVHNVLSWFRGDSILYGDFNFESANTDLGSLMRLTSGIGADEEDNEASEGPYMVPKGVDLILRANVRQATMNADTITSIAGDVLVKDGILVLDGLSFTTPAADMQLTAMYRTPRKNHLYLGIDYHMFDVEISRLLEMLPDIDTIMPMLRSFGGAGEFHIAVETYLDSLYNIKKSTLRGASSIRGEDLVLMDGETFGEIAKTLRFSRKAVNRVDSLSAEFTIFREEIDVYPFLLVMDRYKVVVGGRHNFDLSFDYHISLVESPLPVRLGINIGGNMDEMQYGLASPRYAEFYRPRSRRAVESRQLEFRTMIREALLQNIRE